MSSSTTDLEREQPIWLLSLEVAAIIAGSTAGAIWLAFSRPAIRLYVRATRTQQENRRA